jgi:hypothetical protein
MKGENYVALPVINGTCLTRKQGTEDILRLFPYSFDPYCAF